MIVGEAPGHYEDLRGEPFVGRSGQLLTKMLSAIGFESADVYITNVVKCRPPENRSPAADEIAACSPVLHRQLELVGPKAILTLGNFASQTLLETDEGISKIRGSIRAYRGVPLVPTYHPAALLRNPHLKKDSWEDLKTLCKVMGRNVPKMSKPV